MASRPSIPKGTRDFSPDEILKREYIIDSIKGIFRLFGYQPIETPAMENLTTLLGKYGEEGDRLIFRILNSGDFLSGATDDNLLNRDLSRLSGIISEKGLRYDLTVPFARYVVQHRDEIVFPFKRYQIQPVWRADRPQKGRYREFLQCDVDIIGSNSLFNEFELVKIIDAIFSRLDLRIVIKINNRKILSGVAEYIGAGSRITDITVAIDKIEKIGLEAVNNELRDKGISQDAITKLQPVLQLTGTRDERLLKLEEAIAGSQAGSAGISELKDLFSLIDTGDISCHVEMDLTLARGLDYYTGAIIEVKSADVAIGSICGGGRYDNLTGIFGLDGVSGVGVSFGADRIYDVMNQLDLFAGLTASSPQVLVLNFGDSEIKYCINILKVLRKLGINSEFYPDPVKLKKQISYADSRKIPYIIIAGDEEVRNKEITIKKMSSGEQKKIPLDNLEEYLLSVFG